MKGIDFEDIRKTYIDIKEDLSKRISEFSNVWKEKDKKRILKELIFSIFTPQSKAEKCWKAVEILEKSGLLEKPDPIKIEEKIRGLVRFHRNKTKYMLEATERFEEIYKIIIDENTSTRDKRLWLTKNVKGLGIKEASHFLRNIGLMLEDGAIIDRHIIRFLEGEENIEKRSKVKLDMNRYLHLERKFIEMAKRLDLK
ncbi:MAG: DNA lyase, partial [Thermosulfidibacteraceae bacterium]